MKLTTGKLNQRAGRPVPSNGHVRNALPIVAVVHPCLVRGLPGHKDLLVGRVGIDEGVVVGETAGQKDVGAVDTVRNRKELNM